MAYIIKVKYFEGFLQTNKIIMFLKLMFKIGLYNQKLISTLKIKRHKDTKMLFVIIDH